MEIEGEMEEEMEGWRYLELEAVHGSMVLLENILVLILVHLRGDAGILLLHAKVMLN